MSCSCEILKYFRPNIILGEKSQVALLEAAAIERLRISVERDKSRLTKDKRRWEHLNLIKT